MSQAGDTERASGESEEQVRLAVAKECSNIVVSEPGVALQPERFPWRATSATADADSGERSGASRWHSTARRDRGITHEACPASGGAARGG